MHKQRVRDIVARIHGELTIAPTAPSMPPPSTATTSENQTTVEVKSEIAVSEQVEIPFVPASERQQTKLVTTTTTEKDTIVVVGKPQRKKRKKERKAADASGTGSPQLESEEAADATAFDYSAVSNILDEASDHEPDASVGSGRKRKQKQRQRQGKGIQYHTRYVGLTCTFVGPPDTSAFRAPPKAPAEVRRGNQSRTFR